VTGIARWAENTIAAFDTETTGPDPTEARIVTACIAVVNDGPVEPLTWLINPGVEIPAEATAIHGITTEHAREHGTDPRTALTQIRTELYQLWDGGWPVLAYNASYDLTVLDAELMRYDLEPLHDIGPVIDPLVLDRYRRGARTLTAACAHYQVRLDGAHDASNDALAAARVAWRIAQRYPQVAGLGLAELTELQAGMHRAWAENFQQYLRGKGSSEVVDPSWPLRAVTPPREVAPA
jgi:DNA polymerase-3 subunit epsilon